MPERTAALFRVVHVLLRYGRHLAETVKDRAVAPGFAHIAACFGTTSLPVILAHLHRGILRAVALERVLLARAASGRDLEFAAPRIRTTARPPASATADSKAPPAPQIPALPPMRSLLGCDHPADFDVLTLEQLEAQVRRRPLGRTIVDICLDLAVVPGFCTGAFWNELFDLTRCYGGSIASMVQERWRREQAFHREQDRHPTHDRPRLDLRLDQRLDQRREAIRRTLGFFIGEEPVAPATLATGPPWRAIA
jgi:hypothetical protein